MKRGPDRQAPAMEPDADDTVVLRPRRGWRVWPWATSLVLALSLAGALGWQEWRRPHEAAPIAGGTPQAPAVVSAQPRPQPQTLPPLASEADILASAPAATETRRFGPQPDIVVMQFTSLAEQARTLNRAAALIERAGFPRGRVLEDAELDRMIRASGTTPEKLYDGHDYRAADLLRFFAMAEQAGVTLSGQEAALRAATQDWGWAPGTTGALITLVRTDPANGLDAAARATVLRHELSHGEYFTSAPYAAYARQFWNETLTAAERNQFRAFLGQQGYDTDLDDLMVNETQAYLMHTADTRFFNAAAVGMTPARLDVLRGLFLTGMPPSWLRDCTTSPASKP